MRLFSFGGYGSALAALALMVFGAYDSYPFKSMLRQQPPHGKVATCGRGPRESNFALTYIDFMGFLTLENFQLPTLGVAKKVALTPGPNFCYLMSLLIRYYKI